MMLNILRNKYRFSLILIIFNLFLPTFSWADRPHQNETIRPINKCNEAISPPVQTPPTKTIKILLGCANGWLISNHMILDFFKKIAEQNGNRLEIDETGLLPNHVRQYKSPEELEHFHLTSEEEQRYVDLFSRYDLVVFYFEPTYSFIEQMKERGVFKNTQYINLAHTNDRFAELVQQVIKENSFQNSRMINAQALYQLILETLEENK